MPNDLIPYSQVLEDPQSVASDLETSDVMAIAREDVTKPTGFKSMVTRFLTIAKKIVNGIDYTTELDTTAKTITGAINEVNANSGSTNIIGTASGAVASFDDGGDDMPVKSLITEITATQAGTGTPSPSNVRSISGVDTVNVVVTGKNLMPSLFGSNTNNGITYTVNDDNTITVTGQVPTGNSNRNYGHIILPAGTYILSGFPDTLASTTVKEAALVLCKDIYSGSQNIIISLYSNIARTATFTLTEATDCYLRIYLYAQAGAMPVNTVFKVQIEKGEEATEYEKYKGTTHTITLPETIYGGTADLANGTGIKTHENIASYNGETINEPWLCSEAPFVSGTTPPTGSQVVYPLATPTTISFTPEQIPTLSGLNNIFSNTGDVEIEYFNENADQMAELIDAKQEFANYSFDERIVGTWTDGSPLYEKTLFFNNVKLDKTDGTSELLHGVENIGLTRFVVEAYFKFPNSGQDSWSPANNGLWNNGVYNFYWCVGETSIFILSASGVYFDANPNRSYLVKIRYTKA